MVITLVPAEEQSEAEDDRLELAEKSNWGYAALVRLVRELIWARMRPGAEAAVTSMAADTESP